MLYYTRRDWNCKSALEQKASSRAQPLIKWLFGKELREVKTKSFSRNGKIQLINLLIVNNVSKFKINELRSVREKLQLYFHNFPFLLSIFKEIHLF